MEICRFVCCLLFDFVPLTHVWSPEQTRNPLLPSCTGSPSSGLAQEPVGAPQLEFGHDSQPWQLPARHSSSPAGVSTQLAPCLCLALLPCHSPGGHGSPATPALLGGASQHLDAFAPRPRCVWIKPEHTCGYRQHLPVHFLPMLGVKPSVTTAGARSLLPGWSFAQGSSVISSRAHCAPTHLIF